MKQVFVDDVSAQFYLRDKRKEYTTIDMLIRVDRKLYKYCTGLRVAVADWHVKHQVAVSGHKHSALNKRNNEIINVRLDDIRNRINKAKVYYCAHCQDRTLTLTQVIRKYMRRGDVKHNDVLELFKDLFANEYTNRSDKNEVECSINLFSKFYESNKVSIASVAKKSYFLQFKDFVIKECAGLSATTANHRMGVIITFVNKLDDRGYIDGSNELRNWNGYKLKNDTAKDNIPFLHNEEVMTLFRHTCNKQEDEKYKDVFLLECATGQRISDIENISDKIQRLGNRYVLDIITKKENKRVKCSVIFQLALDILSKYNFKMPHVNKDHLNKKLKVICKEAGLNRIWTTSKHRVGQQKTDVEQKYLYEVITSHVGRHTFDSLLKMRGWSTDKISSYAGHNSDMVERYTTACTDVDTMHYEEVRKNNIDDIVLTIEEFEERKKTKENVDNKELLLAIKEVSFKLGFGVNDIRGDVDMRIIRDKIMNNDVTWETIDTEKMRIICRYVYLFSAWTNDVEMVLTMERNLYVLGIYKQKHCANRALVEARFSDIINNNVRDIYGIDRWIVGSYANPVDFI
ncbi:MAG: tyrosine-type recombinase/integrase [Bacteroidales bacterium]|nr:tyrosine-type recombinase/integrase [Bacteroidales bacterium]